MPEHPEPESSRLLVWICWLPLASLIAIEWSLRSYDGWGAWASAPLLLLPGILSLAITLSASIDCIVRLRAGTFRPAQLGLAVVSSLPIWWLLVRRHLL